MPTKAQLEGLTPAQQNDLLSQELAKAEKRVSELEGQVAVVSEGNIAEHVNLMIQEKVAAGLPREMAKDVALRQVVEDEDIKKRAKDREKVVKAAEKGEPITETDLAKERLKENEEKAKELKAGLKEKENEPARTSAASSHSSSSAKK